MVLRVKRNAVSALCLLLGAIVITAFYSFPSLSSDAPDYARQWTNDAIASISHINTDDNKNELVGQNAPEKPIIEESSGSGAASNPFAESSSSDPTIDTTIDTTSGSSSVSATSETDGDGDADADDKEDEKFRKPFTINPAADEDKKVEYEKGFVPSKGFTPEAYFQIFSNSTKDGKYFQIEFGEYPAINPNIIPHPKRANTWMIVAQKHKQEGKESPFWFAELVCDAVFKDGKLSCEKAPWILPIAPSKSGNCSADLAYATFNAGPHDARVFWGPKFPYIVWGSNSRFNCFGQWIQDFRLTVHWPESPYPEEPFRFATDLQRPPPIGPVEKNWFPFWDADGDMYLHYDVAPERMFARLMPDGSVGDNMAAQTADQDSQCIAKHWPKMVNPEMESIHQGTNSLAVTLCRRTDGGCKANKDNTYVMHVFQHKKYYGWHSVYEPYVMLFRQSAPFDLYAISGKPFWIHGRKTADESKEIAHLKGQTEMMYITSINWKEVGLHYHGYLDDVIMLGFGHEDKRTAGIDVTAGDLLQELALCSGDGSAFT